MVQEVAKRGNIGLEIIWVCISRFSTLDFSTHEIIKKHRFAKITSFENFSQN